MLERVKQKLAEVDTRMSTSTFGRIFRLDGSGHVRNITVSISSARADSWLATRAQECQILDGGPRWTHDLFHDGIYHCS